MTAAPARDPGKRCPKSEIATRRALAQQIAPRLMAEVEHLEPELARARIELASKVAPSLEMRLHDVGTFNHGGCPSCRDAEARAFLASLQRIAGEARK